MAQRNLGSVCKAVDRLQLPLRGVAQARECGHLAMTTIVRLRLSGGHCVTAVEVVWSDEI